MLASSFFEGGCYITSKFNRGKIQQTKNKVFSNFFTEPYFFSTIVLKNLSGKI